jgi:DNA-binding IclR family transcriptional regulator
VSETVMGAQVVARAVHLLKLVGERTEGGWLIAELVSKSSLTRPTVYRLLSALEAAGLIEQDANNRRWHLGTETYVLGLLAAGRFNIERIAHPAVIRIADQTGESAFLSIRRGAEAVCLIREEGTYPIRTHVLQAGDRHPLGVGSASLAMLAALPDLEVEDAIKESRELLKERYPKYSQKLIRQFVAETRQAGYSVNRGLLLGGSWGVAASINDPAGRPIAALSVTAVEARLQGERLSVTGKLLIAEARRLSSLVKTNGH